MSDDIRVVDCVLCDGTGHREVEHRWWSSAYRCTACGGAGEIEVELMPLEMEDLDGLDA